jgi:hypothetical protein
MKKIFVIIAIVIASTSCTLTTFVEKDLALNYELNMTSKKEKVLLEKIPVYLSEKDIPKDFVVKSINVYNPHVLPIIGNRKKTIISHLYKKTVKAVEKQKGDAALIIDDSHFKVLKFKE